MEEEGARFIWELFAGAGSCSLAPFSNNLKANLPVGFSRPQ